MPHVVVTVLAERLTDMSIALVVDGAAPQGSPVLATLVGIPAPVVAPPSLASLAVIACGVHGPETGRGQRDEHLRVFGDCGRQIVMATVHAGVYELPGIAGIEIRAGRAGDSASVVASGPHPKLATEAVGSCQTDRIRTEPSILRFIPPGLEVAGGGATHHLRHHAADE
ncbi:MAG TPA: hypothetical protein PKV55_11530, partial [Nitrospira sp.]|nr:hypothetical protein [Nitrospira sp.]